MGNPTHHLAAQQAVGSTHINLAGTLAKSFRLGLCPLEALACCHGNGVHENSVVLLKFLGVTKHAAHLVVHWFTIRSVRIGWVRPADVKRGSPRQLPRVAPYGACNAAHVEDVVFGPVPPKSQRAGLEVNKQSFLGIKSAGLSGLSSPSRAENAHGYFVACDLEPVVCFGEFKHLFCSV